MQNFFKLRPQIRIDKISGYAILSVLSLSFLPRDYLLSWQASMILFVLLLGGRLALAIISGRRCLDWLKTWLNSALMMTIFIGYAHFTATQALQQAEVPLQKIQAQFQIKAIQHQGEYTSLIVQTAPSSSQPARRIYVNWHVAETPQIGEIWQGTLAVKPISSRLNNGGFERQKWYMANHIQAVANIKSAVKIAQDFSWREQRLVNSMVQTQDLSQQGLLLALGFGERAWITPTTWKIYQQTNTAHLIAISGLHIGLAMALGFWLGRALQYVLPTRWIRPIFPLLCGLLLALFYANLAGLAIPTFRASLALSVIILLRILRGYCTPWQLYCLVIALLLLSDPLMVLSTSFWLSASAVACLILWYRLFPLNLLLWRGQPISSKVRWILALFHLQLGLFCFFTPVQLAFFGGFSLQGLVANLIAVPLYSFLLVPLVLLAVLTGGGLNSWQWADRLADSITQLLAYFQHSWIGLSDSQIQYCCLILLVGIMGSVYWLYHPRKLVPIKPFSSLSRPLGLSFASRSPLPPHLYRLVQLGGCGLIGLLSLSLIWRGGQQPDWQVDTLDVGQGLSTLIVKNQRGILYDTGASWQGGSMAELEIIPYLQRQGIALDYVILSHDDNDHAGGATAILKAFPHSQLITPSAKNYDENHRTFCQQGAHWQWQGIDIQALSPEKPVVRAENADSCVLLVQQGEHSVLLTGDADLATERRLMPQLPKIELLQVGHHGSKTSTGADFVERIQPDIALISSGRWNQWKFPHTSVIAHLEQVQSAVYNTAVSGQISVRFYGDNTKIATARNAFSPWYQQIITAQQGD
ncbi:DNA internalization-related competence protein ComEC/Rec2 [Lonepinella sp. BR2474]|uniref:DNA internalization-related competence protein ComEC/Rec2 n=1 Tax=Lonepinella sp. BR2474 TaxID=3434548 RepID=UPI003F6DADB9